MFLATTMGALFEVRVQIFDVILSMTKFDTGSPGVAEFMSGERPKIVDKFLNDPLWLGDGENFALQSIQRPLKQPILLLIRNEKCK